MPQSPAPSSTKTIKELVLKADPEWPFESKRPVVYQFSGDREFRQKANPYS